PHRRARSTRASRPARSSRSRPAAGSLAGGRVSRSFVHGSPGSAHGGQQPARPRVVEPAGYREPVDVRRDTNADAADGREDAPPSVYDDGENAWHDDERQQEQRGGG